MTTKLKFSSLLLALACGCSPANNSSTGNVTMDGPPPATVDAHEHPSEGPHHGTLVELGKEEFHAEVVHAADTITVYILDAHAEKSVPIDATEVTINVLHEGKPEQYKLPATPDANDGVGQVVVLYANRCQTVFAHGRSCRRPLSLDCPSTAKPIAARSITIMPATITHTSRRRHEEWNYFLSFNFLSDH